jgi:hypothetical protein
LAAAEFVLLGFIICRAHEGRREARGEAPTEEEQKKPAEKGEHEEEEQKQEEQKEEERRQHNTHRQRDRQFDTSSIVHVLRFLRNAKAHRPKQGSGAAAIFEGTGMAGYFVSCFPKLALEVWPALDRAGWSTRTSLHGYYSSSTPSSYSPLVLSPTFSTNLRSSATTTAAVATSRIDSGRGDFQPNRCIALAPCPLRAWLVPINPALEQYTGALVVYGYEDTTILREAEEAEDLLEAFEEAFEGRNEGVRGTRSGNS